MAVVKIGSNNYKSSLKQRFELESKILAEDDYHIKINQIKQGDILFFECSTVEDELMFDILREFIANIISDLIINDLELDFLYKITDINCKHLQLEEKNKIVDIALNRLNILSSKTDKKIEAKLNRKNRVLLEVVDYIVDGQEIVVEGFIRFRLKNYIAELELAVKTAIEEYGVEKEYREIIHLLKDYIDIQASDNNLVNIIKIENNGFKLLNQQNEIIENPFLDEYILAQLEQELDYNDLIISALISIAPKEIILHFKTPVEMVENLKNVFNDRLSICLGCEYCQINNSEELKEKISTQS